MDSTLRVLKNSLDESSATTSCPIDANQLTFVAEVLLGCVPKVRNQVLPLFNRCAARIGWGVVPAPGAIDVCAKYREAGLITWTSENAMAA